MLRQARARSVFALLVILSCVSLQAATWTITPSVATLEVGDTLQLKLINSSGVVQSGVTWTSANTGLATVNGSGLVTGVAAGSVKIRGKKTGAPAYANLIITAPLPEEPPPPPPLILTCPSTLTLSSPDGNAVPAVYSATTTGGTAPITVVYDPISGSTFTVGDHTVNVTAGSSDGQTATPCSFTVTVVDLSNETVRGTRSSITCPGGATAIATTDSIQTKINNAAAGTTFCLAAGKHTPTAGITPKADDVFVGTFGAIVDGALLPTTGDAHVGIFRAHNQNIPRVTLRNLRIEHCPQRCVHGFNGADDWIIEDSELAYGKFGFNADDGWIVRRIIDHHNIGDPTSSTVSERGGGYTSYKANNVTISDSEFYANGPEQKIFGGTNIDFLSNYYHDGKNGLWCDNCIDVTVDGNTVEDFTEPAIFVEVSKTFTVTNNTVKRSGTGVFVSASQDGTVSGTTAIDNFRAIQFYIDCRRINETGGIFTGIDLKNVTASGNDITVPITSGALASTLFLSQCSGLTAAQQLAYSDGTKNLHYNANDYDVPNVTLKYWVWPNVTKSWAEWQALGRDTTGSVQ